MWLSKPKSWSCPLSHSVPLVREMRRKQVSGLYSLSFRKKRNKSRYLSIIREKARVSISFRKQVSLDRGSSGKGSSAGRTVESTTQSLLHFSRKIMWVQDLAVMRQVATFSRKPRDLLRTVLNLVYRISSSHHLINVIETELLRNSIVITRGDGITNYMTTRLDGGVSTHSLALK